MTNILEILYYTPGMSLAKTPRMVCRVITTPTRVTYEYCNPFKSWTEDIEIADMRWGVDSGNTADIITEQEAMKIVDKWKPDWPK